MFYVGADDLPAWSVAGVEIGVQYDLVPDGKVTKRRQFSAMHSPLPTYPVAGTFFDEL